MSAVTTDVAITSSAQPATTPGFPDEHDLCEQCGYALRGLPRDGACPECGKPIAASDPARRTGLPLQIKRSLRAWLATAWMIAVRPRRAFQVMRIERDPKEGRILDRTQLALYALLLSLFWLSGAVLASNFRASQNQSLVEMALRVGIWLLGPALAVILLSYIEAVGVAWFSRRRGWRVAFRTAERVVSYSMIGWLPASIVCCVMYLWYGGLLRWPLPAWLFPGDYRDLFVLTLVGSISILWFETLVWLGVREVKFANGR